MKKDSITELAVLPRLELCGNSRCVVEGLKGIVEYTKGKIKIDLGKFSVCFFGDDLYINSFTREGATVEGTIISLEFEGDA
ncbi:MAG: YabP/YqfC family sporulation protein [Eubacterium sp.]|nr:YabP/YqfC family sporulation protein [Eubacterium sp.]MBR7072436.1 YabP/YqfC family sporulation protein [Eubacterium sp.]